MKRFLFLLLLPLTASSGAAEPLTLQDCLNRALEVSPTLAQAQLRVEMARAKLDEVRGLTTPRFEGKANFGVVPAARGDIFGSPDSDTGSLDSLGPFFRGEIQVAQPLYTFGKAKAGRRAASGGILAEEQKALLDRNQLVFEVRKAHALVLFTSSLNELAEETRDRLNQALDKAQELFDAEDPSVTQQDLAKLKVFAAQVESQALAAATAKRVSREALAALVGLEDGSLLELKARHLSRPRTKLKSLESLVEEGLENRPELSGLKHGIEAHGKLVEVEEKKRLPDLFIGAQLRYAIAPNREDQTNPFVKDDFNFFNYGAAFGMRWALPFKERQAKIRQARLEQKKLQSQEVYAQRAIEVEIKKVYWAADESLQRVKVTRNGLKAARGWMLSENQLYQVGTGSTKNLLESLGAYAQAKKDDLEAIQKAIQALAELDRVLGRLPEGEEAETESAED